MKKTEMDAGSDTNDGSQAVRKAVSLLKAIARMDAGELSLAQIARIEGMPRSTAHRMLQCLIDEGLVQRCDVGKGYQLGEVTHELGMASFTHAAAIEKWRGLVKSVARRTSVTAYLMRRSGLDAACLVKAEGSGVVRVVPVEVGQRRSLGLGAGSIALLSRLDDDVVRRVEQRLKLHRHDSQLVPGETGLWESVRLARETGFALSHGRVSNGTFGMGAVIPTGEEPPRLAISIAAHTSLVTESMIARWQEDMREEIAIALRQA